MVTLVEATERVVQLRINWMEVLMFGMGGLLTLGMLAFFIILFAQNRKENGGDSGAT